MNKLNINIRGAMKEDVDEIVTICSEHAEYEGVNYISEGKAQRLSQSLFSEPPKLYCLIAEHNNKIVGYSTFMYEYSTWDAEFYIHMDCLYVREEFRGHGIGRQLIKEIAKHSRLKGFQIIQWQTPSSNTRAIQFYKKLGANSLEKHRFYLRRETINQILNK